MSNSTLITDYLGTGLASARPSSPPVSSGALSLYRATDTGALSAWSAGAWYVLGGVATVAGLSGTVTVTQLNTAGLEITTNKGVANGYAPLDSSSRLPFANLPVSSGLSSAGAEVTANRGVASGYAPLDSSSRLPYANLPVSSGLSSAGAEVTANRGVASGYAPLDSSSRLPYANLPTSSGLSSAGAEVTANKGVASGYPSLDSSGKIPTSQLPASVVGGVSYVGTWDASANSPALVSGTGAKGSLYKVSVAGTTTLDGVSTWSVGDQVVFDGTVWDKIDGQPTEVSSVVGAVGAITLSTLVAGGVAPSSGATLTSPALAANPSSSDSSLLVPSTSWVGAYVASLGYTTGTGYVLATSIGAASGVAPLDSSSRLPYARLPTSSGLSSAGAEVTANRGVASGYAPLDSGALVPTANLPTGTATARGVASFSTGLAVSSGTVTVVYGTTSTSAAQGNLAEYVTNKGAASGYAPLDSSSKVPLVNLPAAVAGALNYVGTWNASTNNPPLTSGSGTKGNYYKVSTAGTTTLDGISQWNPGDLAVFDGTTWDKIDGLSSEVLTVAGQTGNVTTALLNANGVEISSNKNVASGYAPLDGSGLLPAANLPTTAEVTTNKGAVNGYAPLDSVGKVAVGYIHVSGYTTQTANDNTSNIATTQFVQTAVNGIQSITVSGSATLTATQAGSPIIKLTGTLSSNVTVSVPATTTHSWIVINSTTGAYTLTFNVTGGSGLVLAQGTSTELYSDGTNINLSTSTVSYSQMPAEVQSLPIPFVMIGKPAAAQIVNIVMVQACTLPANLAGAMAFFTTAPAASAAFTISRIASGSTTVTTIGTATLSSGSNRTLALSTQAAVSLAVGDVLQLSAPSTQDTALSDGCLTLMAYKV